MPDDNVVEMPMVTRKQFEHAADQMDRQANEIEQILSDLRERIEDIRVAIKDQAWDDES